MEKIVKLWLKYYDVFLRGLCGTLWISAVTVLCGTLLGMLIALMHMGKIKPLRAFAEVYVEILRGTPVLLQLYVFWIGLPKIMPFELTDTQSVVIAMIINSSAYISEIIRAGINAVDRGQWEAAVSLGLSNRHVMTRIILPQAVKNILPALGNEFITIIKETSLASTFFVGELMTTYAVIKGVTFSPLPTLMDIGILYFVMTFTLSKLLGKVERRI